MYGQDRDLEIVLLFFPHHSDIVQSVLSIPSFISSGKDVLEKHIQQDTWSSGRLLMALEMISTTLSLALVFRNLVGVGKWGKRSETVSVAV